VVRRTIGRAVGAEPPAAVVRGFAPGRASGRRIVAARCVGAGGPYRDGIVRARGVIRAAAIPTIVPAIPTRLASNGQSGRVPQSRIVPSTSHAEIHGAGLRAAWAVVG
jgi:hypothetical protein